MNTGAISLGQRPSAAPARHLVAADAGVLLVLLAACLVTRVAMLGDSNFHDDDLFYFLVGQRMHDGLLPYVDVWDRKPFGLFAINYLIAGLSRQVWALQLAGWSFTVATGWVIHRIVMGWTSRLAGLLAGICYVSATMTLGGEVAQAPVFYNLFVALAVLMVAREMPAMARGECGKPIWFAMALCGLAITVKQTALFESLFLGVAALFLLWRGGAAAPRLMRLALGFGLVGAAPTLTIAAAYAGLGHWHEFWNAMVRANLVRPPVEAHEMAIGARAVAMRLLALSLVTAWAMLRCVPDRATRAFVAGWLLAALAGFLSVPNFFVHYALPLLLPLCVISGFAFAHANGGRLIFAALLCFDLLWHPLFDFAATRKSIDSMREATAIVESHDGGGGLLVFKGPPYLYALTGKPFLSPLVFPHHLDSEPERDVSHLNTSAELDRILAGNPGIVVIGRTPESFTFNREAWRKVGDYVRSHCHWTRTIDLYSQGSPETFDFHGDCKGHPGQ